MNQLAKVSVVTPTFNSIVTLKETIESVLAQDYTNWEHIVMDGGSTDGTVELLRQYPHLKWLSEKDKGHYDAMNKGIKRASGEIIAILNGDDYYRSDALGKIVRAFGNHAAWDALFTDVVYVDGDSREIFKREEAGYDYDVLRFGDVCYIVHPTLFVRKRTYDQLGLYRHEQFLNCCDVDFILRLGRDGCKVGHIPESLVYYRIHEHGQTADRRVAENTRREYLAIRKEHGLPDGTAGKLLSLFARVKRQLQKLIHRGKIDVRSGRTLLEKHMRETTTFSSNIGVDKLQ